MTWRVKPSQGLVQKETWRQNSLMIERVTIWSNACAYTKSPWTKDDITDILVQVDDLDMDHCRVNILWPNPVMSSQRSVLIKGWEQQGAEAWEQEGWQHTKSQWLTQGTVDCEPGEPPAPVIFGDDD